MKSPICLAVFLLQISSGFSYNQSPCLNYPEEWTLIAGRCYYSPADYQSFEAAQKECQAFGANLVSYGTLEEENNVDSQ